MFQNVSANLKTDIITVPPSYKMKHYHEHNRNELFFMVNGICTIYIKDNIYKVESGTIVLIPTGVSHKTTYLSNSYHTRMLLYFDDDELDWITSELGDAASRQLKNNFVLHIPDKKINYITEIIKNVAYEFNGIDYMSNSFSRAYLHQLLLFLLRCQLYKENVIQKMDVANEQIQKVIEYIIQNYSTDITLASTATIFHMSESSLSKKFKAFTGYRFKEYVINIRTHAAADALLNTNRSITQIASDCGFSDSNTFGDTFKRVFKVSPSMYRKRV